MSKIQRELEALLAKKLVDRDELLAEMRAVRSAVKKDNPKQNKWLTTIVNRIDELDKFISQKENQIQAIKQRKQLAENNLRRKQDAKRKILMGAMVEHLMKTNKVSKEFVMDELESFLTRDSDKALFADYFSDDHQDFDSSLS